MDLNRQILSPNTRQPSDLSGVARGLKLREQEGESPERGVAYRDIDIRDIGVSRTERSGISMENPENESEPSICGDTWRRSSDPSVYRLPGF
jgi:hypothetical protein